MREGKEEEEGSPSVGVIIGVGDRVAAAVSRAEEVAKIVLVPPTDVLLLGVVVGQKDPATDTVPSPDTVGADCVGDTAPLPLPPLLPLPSAVRVAEGPLPKEVSVGCHWVALPPKGGLAVEQRVGAEDIDTSPTVADTEEDVEA